jgi:hypothetical protein
MYFCAIIKNVKVFVIECTVPIYLAEIGFVYAGEKLDEQNFRSVEAA